MKLTIQHHLTNILKQIGVAALYALSLYVGDLYFESEAIVGYFEPASGLALAALLIGGKRYTWGVLFGAILINSLSTNSFWAAVTITSCDALQAFCGAWLLTREGHRFDLRLQSLRAYLRLILLGGCASVAVGALAVNSALLFSRLLTPENYFHSLIQWWMSDTLGVILITPLILVWWRTKNDWREAGQKVEAALLLGLTVLAGQIVFLDWLHDSIGQVAKGYWMFLLATWVAVRLGTRGTVIALLVVATQALLGAIRGTGFFADDIAQTHLANYWLYMVSLSAVSMALATYFTERKQSEKLLHESEQRFRQLADSICEVFWMTDPAKDKMLYISPAYERVWGRTLQSLYDFPRGWLESIHGEDRRRVLQAAMTKQATGLYDEEYRIIRPNGDIRWIHDRAFPIRDSMGAVYRIAGIAEDITGRKETELALKRYKLVIDTVDDGFWMVDALGNLLEANAVYAKMSGYPVDELVNMHISQLEALEQSVEEVGAHARKIIAQGCARFETRHRHKDGHEIDVEVSATFMPESQQFFVFIRDITERKRAKIALRESEANQRAILNNSPYMTWLKDPDGRYLKVNKTYADYVRLEDTRQIIGKTDFDFWPKKLAEKYRADDAEVMALRQQKHIEEPSLDGDTMHWVETFKTPVIDQGGNVLGTTGFARDITGRKQMERSLRDSEARFRAIIEASPVPFALNDEQENITYLNSSFIRTFGYTLEDIPTLADWWPRAYPDPAYRQWVATTWQTHLERSKRKNEPFEPIELSIRCKSGHTRTTLVGAAPIGESFEGVHLVSLYDITERKRVENALAESESRFREIFNTVSDAVFIHDAESGRIIDVNRRMCEMYGLTHEEALACDVNGLSAGTPPYSIAEAVEKIRLAYIGDTQTFDWLARARDGRLFWVEVSLRLALIGSHQRILAVVRDISERKRAEEELRVAATAFESDDGMMVTDAENVILRVNHAFTEITGYTAEEAVGQTPGMLKSDRHNAVFYAAMWEKLRSTGAWKGEIWNQRKNRDVYPAQFTITAVKGDAGEITRYVATLHDITERKKAEEEINNMAFYDTLTQLPNRRMLNDRLGQAMAASKRSGHYGALMFIDLDNFKPLNDTHGHGVGDLLLVEAAHRLTGYVREVDTVARFGGDEFVVMLGELDKDKAESAAQAGIVAEKIRAALAEPYLLIFTHEGEAESTVKHHCAASIGVVVFNSEVDAEDTIKWADMAMYQAKEGGRNLIRFFDSEF